MIRRIHYTNRVSHLKVSTTTLDKYVMQMIVYQLFLDYKESRIQYATNKLELNCTLTK